MKRRLPSPCIHDRHVLTASGRSSITRKMYSKEAQRKSGSARRSFIEFGLTWSLNSWWKALRRLM